METTSFSILLFFLLFASSTLSSHATVSYDRKAILINGQRRILFSGSIHYPRSTPDVSRKKEHHWTLPAFFSFLSFFSDFVAKLCRRRCGKIWFLRPKREGLMWLKPTSSGMFTSLLLAMWFFTPFFFLVLPCFHFPTSNLSFWSNVLVSAWNSIQYNFEGRYDLVRFVKIIQKAGLYAHLRIGPYVCAEWNFG